MTERNSAMDSVAKNSPAESVEALPQLTAEQPDLTWRILGTLGVFRLITAAGLLILFFGAADAHVFGDRNPALFAATAGLYLLFAVMSALVTQRRILRAATLVPVQVAADIAAITLLMHASGGVSSGLGGLLIVFVGAGGLVLPTRFPTLFAAMAAIAILSEQLFSQITGLGSSSSMPAAGVLGGVIFGIALAARPLGRRIQASEALAIQRGVDLANLSELNEYIVQHLRESIVVIDADNTIRLINESASSLLDIDKSGQEVTLATAAPALADFINTWRKDPNKKHSSDFSILSPDQSVRITAHIAPLGKAFDGQGPVLIFLEDASLMNARVQQSKLASLGRLSASIAHEIRNPVGAMSHAGQLLAESEALDDEDRRLTKIIQTHGDRVSNIIENVLQLSRRDSSQSEVFVLKPWLEDFAAEFIRTLELHEGELSVSDVEQDLKVRMDTTHLRQVLWNLCDNAVKYASETGGILVQLQAGLIARTGRPYLEVIDEGLGIDAATADKIFEPFFTARSGGTGLGLYISRELCELNRATLVFEPRAEGGSIFRIVFSDPDRWDALE